jgi:hypothetical protein
MSVIPSSRNFYLRLKTSFFRGKKLFSGNFANWLVAKRSQMSSEKDGPDRIHNQGHFRIIIDVSSLQVLLAIWGSIAGTRPLAFA